MEIPTNPAIPRTGMNLQSCPNLKQVVQTFLTSYQTLREQAEPWEGYNLGRGATL